MSSPQRRGRRVWGVAFSYPKWREKCKWGIVLFSPLNPSRNSAERPARPSVKLFEENRSKGAALGMSGIAQEVTSHG